MYFKQQASQNKKNKTNQQLHLFQSLPQLFNLVLGCLESGLQLETDKEKQMVCETVGPVYSSPLRSVSFSLCSTSFSR